MFKRAPVAISFAVESIPPDTKISIIKMDRPITRELIDEVHSAWMECFPGHKAIVLADGVSLEVLSDSDLKAIGLMRVKEGNHEPAMP